MTLTIRLHGEKVHHNGHTIGGYGRLADNGERVFVDYSDMLYDEMAFTISKEVLENMKPVEYIAFRDKSHDLFLFDADEFMQVLNGDFDENHYTIEPHEYGQDDKQVAVKAWQFLSFHSNQGEEFELTGGKYNQMDNI